MIVIPVRCLRCGGWTLRSPRQLRTPRRHAPRWMRNAPALVMAGGVQIGPSGVTIGSGGVIVTDADGTPCCCSGSSSSSGSFSSSSGSASIGSGSGSSGSGSGGGICPTDCSSCPNTLSATWTLDVSSISLHCTSTGTITRGAGANCNWTGSWSGTPSGCFMLSFSLGCSDALGCGWGFTAHTSGDGGTPYSCCGHFFGSCPSGTMSCTSGDQTFSIAIS
jgi:hypothetical protein